MTHPVSWVTEADGQAVLAGMAVGALHQIFNMQRDGGTPAVGQMLFDLFSVSAPANGRDARRGRRYAVDIHKTGKMRNS